MVPAEKSTSAAEQPISSMIQVQPSIRLLFSLIPRRQIFFLIIPAVIFSILSGGIAPFMTYVVGQFFDAFARFPLQDPTEADKQMLLYYVGIAAIELVGLAVGALALSSITSSLWIWTGEQNALALRKRVYDAITNKDLEWFDTKMGAEEGTQLSDVESGPVGAGGLMAKFSRETDDVRMASSLASGMLLQYLTTCITCLALAFSRSGLLTLVILSAVPVLVITQVLSQVIGGPLLAVERAQTTAAATIVERATAAISTVKAFNAASYEQRALASTLEHTDKSIRKLVTVWGLGSGFAQFATMAMFVQGFWFGAKLVREGRASAGDVMAVFWACLIASSNLASAIPQLIVLAKGKFAMASLLTLVESGTAQSTTPLRKIMPSKCAGELALQNITFAYPSRPSINVLEDVSLFLPARETTFIVGGSGSGKSTIAQLLLRMYQPRSGSILLDNQDIAFLHEGWTREHLAGLSQECILFDMSVHDNVAMGLASSGSARKPADATQAEVVEACRAALIHDFVRDLPEGYDTKLGNGGANLSGGQKQRLAIARAKLRNPTVLILDEATSALDATSRVLVFEAIKRWRKNKTTVVITHDLSQISSGDFVYVLKTGRVVEQGYRYDLEGASGEFSGMVRSQHVTGGYLPEKELPLKLDLETSLENRLSKRPSTRFSKRQTLSPLSLRPLTLGTWVLDDLTNHFSPGTFAEEDAEFLAEKSSLQRSGTHATSRRRERRARARGAALNTVKIDNQQPPSNAKETKVTETQQSFWSLIKDMYSTVPRKFYLLFGIFICLCNGLMTPVFSFLLSRLIFEVSIGAKNISTVNQYGGLVLGIAAIDGILLGLKYFIMETAAMTWVTRIRNQCFRTVLAQDKKWFDKSDNRPARLTQVLIKDGDDARTLIATVLGQCCVVVSMLGVGLLWAMVRGWQLTLVGLAIAPVFVATMALQTGLAAKYELRNKRSREDVASVFYEVISNVRGIRSMGFESVFRVQFTDAAYKALNSGVKGAFVEGCTYGVASALIYLAEALLFYVGAVLIARGTYTYLRMVEVLNLVVFTVVIGSQLMGFTQKIAKSVQATRDFNQLLRLSTCTDESHGILSPPLTGDIKFSKVCFSYPERPDVPVLKNLSLDVAQGECVAIVGASGSGKSTVAALLQRLYEPSSGAVTIGLNELRATDVNHLREHVAVVSQNPHLFDASITDNITYGNNDITDEEVRRAAVAANVHDFIMTLPNGYETKVGENASLISGGQAQRLQIARALARPSTILILDECTSALDPSNQAAILDTITNATAGRTTLMVTHKLPVMRMCHRILVIHEGKLAEQGTFEELMARKGVFAQLASGGEWVWD